MRTKEECAIEALKYKTRSEFKKNSYGVYQTARSKKWLDDICQHMNILHSTRTKEECAIEALKYKTRSEFKKSNYKIYNYAVKHSWISDICKHMDFVNEYHSKESCADIANNFSTRIEFARTYPNVYYSARHNGWLDDICQHMEYDYPDPDIVYVWKVKGSDIWKVGITNSNRIEKRISEVAEKNGFSIESVFYKQTSEARKLEKQFLELGEKIDLPKKDGYTEFRKFDASSVNYIIRSFLNA